MYFLYTFLLYFRKERERVKEKMQSDDPVLFDHCLHTATALGESKLCQNYVSSVSLLDISVAQCKCDQFFITDTLHVFIYTVYTCIYAFLWCRIYFCLQPECQNFVQFRRFLLNDPDAGKDLLEEDWCLHPCFVSFCSLFLPLIRSLSLSQCVLGSSGIVLLHLLST